MPDYDEDMLPPPASGSQQDRTWGGNNAFHNFFNDFSHIPDPNLRRRLALSEIDKVPFGAYHVRAVLVAGVGFFLDSYDIFAINLITILLGVVFWGDKNPQNGFSGNDGYLPDRVNQAFKASTSAGIVAGMIVFGWLADGFGRRRIPAMGSTGLLIFWRIIMGIGIGGDYPLSSVITSEFAPTRWRGAMVAAVFSMQGLGQLAAAIVALITTVAFKDAFSGAADESQCGYDCRLAADRAWRIIVGVGAIPACFALYYRITLPETPRYTFDVEHDIEKADADIKAYVTSKGKGSFDVVHQVKTKRMAGRNLNVPRASWSDLISFFRQWTNFKMLLGTTLSWFFLDLAFYGLGLNNIFVLQAIGYGAGNTLFEKLHNQSVGMIILTCAGSLPGYWTAILTVDTFGRKPLQIIGFLLLTILFCVLGFAYSNLTQGGLLALYIIGQFLFNAGPNTTTFIVPGECFPTRYRSTGHGISAAMGKIGAIVAQGISIPMVRQGSLAGCQGTECTPNMHRLLQLFALFMLFGTLVSLLIPETKGMTLEELSGEPRTSYNSGCNGSISLGSPKLRAWNPFHGGQPAGFSYPRSRKGQFRKGDRVGIMTSPELMAETSRLRKTRLWRRHRKAKSSSGTDIALSTRSSGTADDEIFPAGAPAPVSTSPPPPPPPSWGAGWGRIDRGGPPPLLNSVQLQDVGSLLTK
ncbi:hypothetical protein ACHAPA_006847 [Fusarium lateritium]